MQIGRLARILRNDGIRTVLHRLGRQRKPMKTFIRATEVWVPTGDRALLELAGGLYGTASVSDRRNQATSESA
jgi:hypothetical protein